MMRPRPFYAYCIISGTELVGYVLIGVAAVVVLALAAVTVWKVPTKGSNNPFKAV